MGKKSSYPENAALGGKNKKVAPVVGSTSAKPLGPSRSKLKAGK